MKKLLILASVLTLWACGTHSHDDGHSHDPVEHEIPTIAVTQWTDSMELFMEYETPVAGNKIKYIIHLTTLADFKPVMEGRVTLRFSNNTGKIIELEKDRILRDGIYTPEMIFDRAGTYDFTVYYTGPEVSDSFHVGSVVVYEKAGLIPEEQNAGTDEFSFLKEQQWKIDFATEEVTYRKIHPALRAVGTVRPQPASYNEITSPVDGIISISESRSLAKPGQKVARGEILGVLEPPLVSSNSWSEIYLNYEQTRIEYDRARRLKEKGAISTREFEKTRLNYETQLAGFSSYFGSSGSSISFDRSRSHFHLIAQMEGTVAGVNILPGQQVVKGQKLLTIVNQETVWLALELYAGQARALTDISGLALTIPGQKEPLYFDRGDFSIVSRGEIIDPVKKTLTVWVSIDNRNRDLLIGQVVNAEVYHGNLEEQLTIPVSAVFEDNSREVVSVHVSGESFEKRVITTGPRYFDHVAVIDGLKPGERVVTRGGYLVKLASTSEAIGHPHAH